MKPSEKDIEDAEIASLTAEVTEFAQANPIFDVKKVFEVLESRPKDVTMGQALVQMLNQAHAVGYVTAKREMQPKKILLFPGYGNES